jgi:MFS transporter, SP family, arabinose:H+ symporter
MTSTNQTGSPLYRVVVPTIASLGGLLFGFDTAVISGTISFLEKQYHLDAVNLGWLVSSALVACIFGAGFAGFLGDRYGRLRPLIACAFLFLLSGIGCAISPSFSDLLIFRMLGGLAIGAASMLCPLYIAEFAPTEVRGRMVALYQFAITVGILAAYFSNAGFGAYVSSYNQAREGWWYWITVAEPWRAMLGAEAVPAAAFLVMLFFVPESPRWLVEQGEFTKAETVLSRISGATAARDKILEIKSVIETENGSILQLFEPRWRRALLIGVALSVAGQVSGINSIIYYAPRIFEGAGLSLGASLGGTVTVGGMLCLFTLLALWKVDSLGRRPLLLVGTAGCALTLAAIGLAFLYEVTSGGVLISLICLFLAFFAFSLGPIPWVVISEIFPTNIRGRAMSIATLALWIGCAVVGQTFPWLLEHFKPSGTFGLYAALTTFSFFIAYVLVPETKGKSLEQIEMEWGARAS